nr:hypothetical protein [Tanacetum cinerariifolium]
MGRRESKCSWERFLESDNGIFDNNDSISRLPETVLHHVVSFLPTLEKDQARFLSRKWRRIAAQSQKKLSLTRRRLDEQELSRILGGLLPLELSTPHLENIRFLGPRIRPCRMEFGICKRLKKDEFKWGCHEHHDVYGLRQNFPPSSTLDS